MCVCVGGGDQRSVDHTYPFLRQGHSAVLDYIISASQGVDLSPGDRQTKQTTATEFDPTVRSVQSQALYRFVENTCFVYSFYTV